MLSVKTRAEAEHPLRLGPARMVDSGGRMLRPLGLLGVVLGLDTAEDLSTEDNSPLPVQVPSSSGALVLQKLQWAGDDP